VQHSEFPDTDVVRRVLAQAVQAPSVHNSQPWIWNVDGESLQLRADPRKYLRHTDPDGRDLLISCGASLHHCTVALASLGWRSTVRRLPDPTDPALLAGVTVRRQPPADLDRLLAEAIGRRRTDRRTYSPVPVPWGDIALMGARAARAGVMLRQIDEIPRLSAIVADAVSRRAADPNYLAELNEWGARRGPVPGQPAENDGANGVVVALGTESDDCLSRLRAGEAASLVLLSATAMGLSSCPITEPLEIIETREEVRTDVFGSDAHPQMLIRLGFPAVGAEPLPATPRHTPEKDADTPH
jgi:nitroreductase